MKLMPSLVMGLALAAWSAGVGAQVDNGQPDHMKTPLDQWDGKPAEPRIGPGPAPMDWGGLKPDSGREETFYFCAPCHSDTRIKAASKTREQWNALIERMLKTYPEYRRLEPDEREAILGYLTRQYGPRH